MKVERFSQGTLGFEPKDRCDFTEQATAKELADLNQRVWAVEHLYDEAKVELAKHTSRLLTLQKQVERLATETIRATDRHDEAASVLLVTATAQQKTIDLLSGRLDKVIGAVVTAREGKDDD